MSTARKIMTSPTMTDQVVLKWDCAEIRMQIMPTMSRNNELKIYLGLRFLPLFLNDILSYLQTSPILTYIEVSFNNRYLSNFGLS